MGPFTIPPFTHRIGVSPPLDQAKKGVAGEKSYFRLKLPPRGLG